MNTTDDLFQPGFEPERYELDAPSRYHFDLPRRDFFKWMGAGLVVLLYADELIAQESGGGRRRGGGQRMPKELAAWLHVGEDGAITIMTGKVEVGQNSRTALAQVVAEELPVPWDKIRLVMGDTDLTPYDAGTFGSQTTPSMVPQLRKVAATAREALIDLAAEHFHTDRSNLVPENGSILFRAEDKSIAYGQLTKGQALTRSVADEPKLKGPGEWKIAGHAAPKLNGEALVTGRHRYSTDIALPGMLYGKVLRAPAYGASLRSIDLEPAKALPGVAVIRDGNFVGVAALSAQAAADALATLKVEWDTPAQPSERELFKLLRGDAKPSGAPEKGSIEAGLAQADHRMQQSYTVAYIAHVPLEPRAAVAEWKDDKLTVWTGTQRPFGVRSELAQAFHIPENKVRVIMPDTGSGYGGKHTGEAAIEAARLAREAGQPVKLVWTREEEFAWAYFRPAGVIEVTSGVTNEGALTAWDFHNYNSGGSAIRPLYDIPNLRTEFHRAPSPLRQGSYRALAATANHFARETHIDELAALVKMDPLAFRLRNIKEPRLRNVLTAAADAFGWGKASPASGHGYGIAGGFEKGSYVATCAEVAVDQAGEIQVVRVVEAFECGAVINPDHVTNQVEGMIMMGLGGALFEAIKFENGQLINGRLSKYRVPRFSDLPEIKVVLVNRTDLPSVGAGETPIVGIAPAVGNAIFQASGKRLRSLPLAPDGLKT